MPLICSGNVSTSLVMFLTWEVRWCKQVPTNSSLTPLSCCCCDLLCPIMRHVGLSVRHKTWIAHTVMISADSSLYGVPADLLNSKVGERLMKKKTTTTTMMTTMTMTMVYWTSPGWQSVLLLGPAQWVGERCHSGLLLDMPFDLPTRRKKTRRHAVTAVG